MAENWKSDIEAIRADYERDGAVVVRNVLPPNLVEQLAVAIDEMMENPGQFPPMAATDLNREGGGRFFSAMFPFPHHPAVAEILRESALPELAARLMDASAVRYFFSHVLVKAAQSSARTPWHTDLPYWPVKGTQIAGIWVPCDFSTPESGVVTYVKGSHRWTDSFKPASFMEGDPSLTDALLAASNEREQRRTLEDIEQHPERYEFISWDVAPGDVLVHNCRTVHGAAGNSRGEGSRRALATRWLGDDARWQMEAPELMKLPMVPDMAVPANEASFDSTQFPLLWQSGASR